MDTFPLPGTTRPVTAVPAPGPGSQRWAGAAAVALEPDGSFVLAYRVRGDGDSVVVARSTDGSTPKTVGTFAPGPMVERPALARTPDGRWRMWVSVATPGTKHWSVGLLEAATPEDLPAAPLRPAFPGDPAAYGVKDPVVRRRGDRWEAWLCCHPLDVPGAEDRMTTAYATSPDGLRWDWHGTVLRGRPGRWDARGARVTAVLDDGRAAYDGRASAAENWFERTGTTDAGLVPDDRPPYDARYLTVLPLADGTTRIWYEHRLPDESHELRTELRPAGDAQSD